MLLPTWISSQEKFEDTKGIIRSRKSKKDRHYKRRNNGLQNITHNTKDEGTRIALKPGVYSGTPER
jgi:hypothetical protein